MPNGEKTIWIYVRDKAGKLLERKWITIRSESSTYYVYDKMDRCIRRISDDDEITFTYEMEGEYSTITEYSSYKNGPRKTDKVTLQKHRNKNILVEEKCTSYQGDLIARTSSTTFQYDKKDTINKKEIITDGHRGASIGCGIPLVLSNPYHSVEKIVFSYDSNHRLKEEQSNITDESKSKDDEVIVKKTGTIIYYYY